MTHRIRNANLQVYPGGSATPRVSGLSPMTQGIYSSVDYCDDYHGNISVKNPLNLSHDNRLAWSFSGTTPQWSLKNWYSTVSLNNSSPWFTSGQIPTDATLTTHSLAVSNPNRPIADVGQIAQDIWDFPHVLKDVWSFGTGVLFNPSVAARLRQHWGKDYLGYQFGLMPTVQDTLTMFNFVDAVEKKKIALNLLRTGGMSRKTKWDPVRGAVSHKSQYAFSLYGNAPTVNYDVHVESNIWTTCHYKLNSTSPYLAPRVTPLQAARYALALDPHNASTVWQLIPWTWLFDWFANTRDLFNAGRNTLDTSCTDCCHMYTTGYRVSNFRVVNWNGCEGIFFLNPQWRYETKARSVFLNPQPTLQFHLPFLDGGQLSILAALGQSRTWTGR